MDKWWGRLWERNGDFPLITAFLFSLVMVQLLVGIGSMSFEFVLPWILLLFFMYGFSQRCWIFYILCEWWKNHKIARKLQAAAVWLVVINGLFLEGVLSAQSGGQWISVILLLIILYLYIWKILGKEKIWNPYSFFGAALFGIFSATGHPAVFDAHGWWGYLCALFCWFFLFYLGLECAVSLVWEAVVFEREALQKKGKSALRWGASVFLLSVALDSIFLLAFFPGVMEYDSYVQMCQVFGEPYSNHHPWLHTMLIKLIYQTGQALLGSNNRGFALYSLFSVGILSFAFAGVIAYLRSRGMRRRYLVFLTGVYVLSPINQMYSIIMWKDIPFAVCVLLFTLLLCIMKDKEKEKGTSGGWWIWFVLLGFFVCFFRSNGLYVFLGMIPFLLWTFWKQRKATAVAIFAVLLMGIVYKGPVFSYFQVSEPDMIESLSIPAQQIAAVIAYDGAITEKQEELLSQVIDLEQVPDAYLGSTGCSDAIKELVREKDNQVYIKEHTAEFVKTWLQLFWNNKRIYVRAFVAETEGYWYHKINFPFIWSTYIQENGMGIYRASQLPETVVEGIRTYLSNYKEHFDKYLSIGLYVYMFFISFIVALRKRSKHMISWLPVLGIWGTLLIATPVWADLRYAYAIYVAVPLLICLSMKKEI